MLMLAFGSRSGWGPRAMLSGVARATMTSHPSDRPFEIGPSIRLVRLSETFTQVRRVVQAFRELVRQLVDPVDGAVAYFVMAHSGSRGTAGEYRSPRTWAVQNRTGSGHGKGQLWQTLSLRLRGTPAR